VGEAHCRNHQRDAGEECDAPDQPLCPEGQFCEGCICKSESCGDGKIGPRERCGEPGLAGCSELEDCVNCVCVAQELPEGVTLPTSRQPVFGKKRFGPA
jgi:hypothetical protein